MWIDAGHSFVVFCVLAMIAVVLVKVDGRYHRAGIILAIFSLAAISHSLGDFFLHANDSHAHFWPLSGWRFSSPVSYWDPQFYGQYFMIFEIVMGIAFCFVLYRRFPVNWVRLILSLAVLAYIAVPAYFIFVVNHH